MNSDSQFEKRLRDQALKPIPSEWRADILRKATRASERHAAAPVGPVSSLEMFKSRLAALLWPAPRAWAALATVWVIIFMMNLSGAHEAATVLPSTEISAAQTRMALKQKQLLMAELAGRTEAREAAQPPTPSPGPRSLRREEISAV